MKITAKQGKWSNKDIEALIVPMGENKSAPKGLPKFAEQLLKEAVQDKSFTGKKNQAIDFALPKSGKLRHVYFVGYGKAKELKPQEFGELVGAAVRQAQKKKMTNLGFWFLDALAEGLGDAEHVAQLIAEYAGLAAYEYNTFLKEKKPQAKNFIVYVANKDEWTAIRQGLSVGAKMEKIINESRDLANHPSNELTPKFFSNFAQEVGKKDANLKVKVIGEKEMAKLGMGAVLGVSRGSGEEAQFVTVEYYGGNKKDAPYVFVGKGITFDTGGISIKPSQAMHEMKYDMCGAASVLAIARIASALKLKTNVVAIMPVTENMPGQHAQKPGDIVRAMDGSTIEVLNTDAEGRLVLADALVYARQYKPKTVIDLATLTGACAVALHNFGSGLMTKDDELAKQLAEAGDAVGDIAWRLPLPDNAKELIKSQVADIANQSSIRWGGAITAGVFLNHFVAGKYKWAHLDIAGMAWNMSGSKNLAPGSTGSGIRVCVEWLRNQVK